MIKAQYINLNMIPSGVMPVLYCSQYDVGRPLGMVVYNGSEAVDLSTYAVTIEGTRTDGTPITAAVTTDGNIAAFETTATMTNVPDFYKTQLVLTDGSGKRVASIRFMMKVIEAAMNENSEGIQEDASLYQQYTGTVQTLISAVRADLIAEANRAKAAEAAEASARASADSSLQSAIASETSTRAAADQNLQAQINQIIAPSGEAPSAAEVENARIGADNVTYSTLGDAIRGQVTDLKNQLDNTILVTDNKLDLDAISTYSQIKSITDYIKCEKSYVAFTFIGGTGNRTQASGTTYNFYGADKNFITSVDSDVSRAAVEIPANCTYVRAILNTANFDTSKAPMVTFFDTQVSTYTDLIYEQFGTAWFKHPKYDIPAMNAEIDAIKDKIKTDICGCTWDWWISSIAKDEYGNIYIGYVDENGNIGVMQKKTDGTCTYKTLGPTQNDDDHNGAAVTVLNSGRVLVVSSSGHSYDNTIRIYRSTSPYSVNCEFENLSVKLRQPTNTLYRTTYAQIFKDDINDVETLSMLFRCVVSENDTTSAITYPVLRSTDGGSTWVLYRGFRKNDLYAKIVNTRTIGLKRIYATSNPVRSANDIVTGLIDFAAMTVKDSAGATLYNLTEVANGVEDGTEAEAGSLIEGLESIANSFSRVVNTSGGIRLRLLDAMEYAASSAIYCVYAKSVDTDYTNYKYYVNNNGIETEIGESGLPFYLYSSYLPGCAIESADVIYYAKNDSGVQDGAHSLHRVTINSGVVSSDNVIMRSESLLIRPIWADYVIAILSGLYNDISAVGTEGSFRRWKLSPNFLRVI